MKFHSARIDSSSSRERRHVTAADQHDLPEVVVLHARAETEQVGAVGLRRDRDHDTPGTSAVEAAAASPPPAPCSRRRPRFGGVSDSL
jgi:hypothetical protein